MISVSDKDWIEKKVNRNSVEKVKQDFNFNEILSKLIVQRNYNQYEINTIKNDLKTDNIFKKDPDFKDAAILLNNTIKLKEKICILGDYDVDGCSSTALLARYFNFIKHPYFYYIPDREKDGYGASKEIFKKLINKKPRLVIMVDCGSTSHDAIDFLNNNKIKSIIIDHHEIYKPYPESNVIINPKKNILSNNRNNFCATFLTYFFLDYFIKKYQFEFNLSKYSIFVLLATVCDVMPLRGINKVIAKYIINNFNIKDCEFIKYIFNNYKLNKKLTIDDLGFLIGPIINSCGRIGSSKDSAELLITDDINLIKKRCDQLIILNNKRKKIETNILNTIDFNKIKVQNNDIIIYCDKNIKEGLIGIIASRLKDYFNKPSIVITRSKNILKASARSTSNYNIGTSIKTLLDKKIIEKGGGHNMAAGFSIKENNLKKLDIFLQNDYLKKIKKNKLFFHYDTEISAASINIDFIKEINKLGPFGNHNNAPTFLIKNLKIIKSKIIKEKHINCIIKPNVGKSFSSISFNSINTKLGQYLLSYKKNIKLIAQINENIWGNQKTAQLNIKDLIL